MSGHVVLYGLASCDTTRAARRWLKHIGVDYHFHDVRAEGVSRALIKRWVGARGWQKVLNRASGTWRALPEGDKADVDAAKAIALIVEHPTLLKRPVLESGDLHLIGFDADSWEMGLSQR